MRATFGPAGNVDLAFGAALGGNEILGSIIAAVSVRWLMSDPDRGRQDEPVWTSKRSTALVAEQFQAVAAFDQRDAFGRQALEFD